MLKRDISLFLMLYKICSYMAITPLNFPKILGTSGKYYPLLVFFLFLSATVYSIIEKKNIFSTHDKLTYIITDRLVCIFDMLFISTCTIGSIKHSKNWKLFFDVLKELERKLNGTDFQPYQNVFVSSLLLLMVHVLFIFVHFFENYIWVRNDDLEIVYPYITGRLVMYYQIWSATLICYITNIFRRRYAFLNRHILTVVNCKWNVLHNKKLNVYERLAEVRDIYAGIYDVIEHFNAIFGGQIFLILLNSGLQILNTINFALYGKDASSKTAKDFNMMYLVIYSLLAGFVVMSCDMVKKSGAKVTHTCYFLQKGMLTSPLKKELLYLGTFTKELNPKFSAAGYFEVKQSVLAALFSTVATHLIICIQFNMSNSMSNQ
ncbi:hypothetical protein NQ317_010157 [Molorchus minor]|uniref:Gustatory receptor n=1 Tax=Molorchus minor TaxID=1323400 RepID=A0ABQ9JFH5_9CUCU|nr:hypothetical protein NQ317_010157 [Molorchus minor]